MKNKRKKFPFVKQLYQKDCGPTCIKIIAKHFGKNVSINLLREYSETTREGTDLLRLSNAAEKIGFKSIGYKISLQLLNDVPLPCILHWKKNHYVVLYEIKKKSNRRFWLNNSIKTSYIYRISDPAYGLLNYKDNEFLLNWIGNNANHKIKEGIVLALDPRPEFYDRKFDKESTNYDLSLLYNYIKKYKSYLLQLIFGLLSSSILLLIFPFLTQSIVDVGIKNKDISFIYLILIAQIMLFTGRTVIEVIRSWILLHLSARINITLVSDFFIKLMKLPIDFFDSKMTGDILQRINDHRIIENILTTSSLNVLFSFTNLIVFSIVLGYYDISILILFIVGSILYFFWIYIFLEKRKDLNYKRFNQVSQEQSKVIELINGMQEIKLHNAERVMRWSWEYIQAGLFKISIKELRLEQLQRVGSNFINEFKNIFITFLSASLVIKGEITIGMMLAITYIVGQLNGPISQLINFMREFQDAKIALQRLSEIHHMEDEEKNDDGHELKIIEDGNIVLSNVVYRYKGSSQIILNNLNLVIPHRKTTAIVGTSGSGKTTLLKLLLKYYTPESGDIKIGNTSLKNLSTKVWRENFGVVMQEGYIYNNTIASNIAVGEEYIDKEKLRYAVDVANIKEYIESLPSSYNTKIGIEGVGLSTGQKQRILIARAVYKNPKYLFFDEATSSLDANNEKKIVEKLENFFEEKTVVIIAHRLSTVINADQIVLLDNGEIVEQGNHEQLIQNRGKYYRLVRNQLNLGQYL